MKELFEIISITIEAAAVALLSLGLIISTGRFLFGAVRGWDGHQHPLVQAGLNERRGSPLTRLRTENGHM